MNTNIAILFFLFLGILFCFCTSRTSAGPASVDFKPDYERPPENAPRGAASCFKYCSKREIPGDLNSDCTNEDSHKT
jgi:hypothetical protein